MRCITTGKTTTTASSPTSAPETTNSSRSNTTRTHLACQWTKTTRESSHSLQPRPASGRTELPHPALVNESCRPLPNRPGVTGTRSLLQPFEHRGQSLPATDAHGLQTVAGVAALHLPRQSRQDARTGRADRVAE